jgi:hypothetical protein
LFEPWVWLGSGLLLVGGTLWVSARLRGWGRRRAISARRQRAARGEARAEVLLASLGYEVEARQVEAAWTVEVDGAAAPIRVRADLLVRRGGRRWVAEVKTGELAPLISCASTRRQLLEYRLAYPAVDGVLLVRPEQDQVHEVRFPLPGPGSGRGGAASFGWGLVAGAALAWALWRLWGAVA